MNTKIFYVSSIDESIERTVWVKFDSKKTAGLHAETIRAKAVAVAVSSQPELANWTIRSVQILLPISANNIRIVFTTTRVAYKDFWTGVNNE